MSRWRSRFKRTMARDFTPNDYLTVTDAADLRFTTGMSISLWAYFDALSNETLVCKGNSAGDPDYLFQASAGGISSNGLALYDGTAWRAGTASVLSTGVWTHCAVTYDGSNWRFYVNGTAQGVVASATSIQTSSNNLFLGQQGSSASNNLDGRMAELGIWNVALGADEINSLAKGFSPIFIRPASRKLYCDLVRDFFDWHGHICAVSSGTTVVPHCRVIRPGSRRAA